jgi:hypothetical protein
VTFILAEVSGQLAYDGSDWEIADYTLSAEIDDYRDDDANE